MNLKKKNNMDAHSQTFFSSSIENVPLEISVISIMYLARFIGTMLNLRALHIRCYIYSILYGFIICNLDFQIWH